jgi:NAD(P)-dependent dehydrogenase (short-subunit alcohol dehydrogenase family)
MTLAGRVALITGAGHGMGEAHARELASRGARVGLCDVDGGAVDAVVASLEAEGHTARGYQCDVRDPISVAAFVEDAAESFGGIDVVVSNAGVGDGAGGIADTSDAQWREQFAVHVDGAFHLVRAAVPWLRRSHHPRIVIVSSEWALRGPGFAHGYTAAKGALLAFARNLAVELARDGVLVNAIVPGAIATRMTADEDLLAVAAETPLGRVGEPEEVSRLVAFLASDDSGFITGQTIPINGGTVIGGS